MLCNIIVLLISVHKSHIMNQLIGYYGSQCIHQYTCNSFVCVELTASINIMCNIIFWFSFNGNGVNGKLKATTWTAWVKLKFACLYNIWLWSLIMQVQQATFAELLALCFALFIFPEYIVSSYSCCSGDALGGFLYLLENWVYKLHSWPWKQQRTALCHIVLHYIVSDAVKLKSVTVEGLVCKCFPYKNMLGNKLTSYISSRNWASYIRAIC